MAHGGTKRVLVVDDEEGIRHLLRLHLESAQYQVLAAENGAAALHHLADREVDVALVDLRLGEEDGIAVMERLHTIQPALPVIIITSYPTPESARAAGQKGAFDYIPKPFAAPELLGVVARAVRASGG